MQYLFFIFSTYFCIHYTQNTDSNYLQEYELSLLEFQGPMALKSSSCRGPTHFGQTLSSYTRATVANQKKSYT